MATCSPSSSAAISNVVRVAAGKRPTRCSKADRSRAVNGIASGRAARPSSCASDKPFGSSSRASGFPAASASSHSRTRSAAAGALSRRSRTAGSAAIPSSTRSGTPGASNVRASPSRTANSIATGSAPSLRALKTSASADAVSRNCASSIRHRSGASSAPAASRLSVAAETSKRSEPTDGASPSAPARRVRLRRGQLAQLGHDRAQQPVQAGEGEVRLHLDTRGAEHPPRAAALRGVPQQCRLARPGLAAQHEAAALAASRDLQQPVDRGALALTADQRPGRPLELRRRHPPIVEAREHSVQTGDRDWRNHRCLQAAH